MEKMFRVSIAGRFFDVPIQEIAPETLNALKAITDTTNTIDPRDLLRAFLESYEINHLLKEAIFEANETLAKNSNQES